METTITTTRDAAWDELALDIAGDEFALNDLMREQIVKDFNSPVYSFIVADHSVINALLPNELVTEETFKAPWE